MITARALFFSFPVENPRSRKRTVKTAIRSTSPELTLDKRKTSACHSSSLLWCPDYSLTLCLSAKLRWYRSPSPSFAQTRLRVLGRRQQQSPNTLNQKPAAWSFTVSAAAIQRIAALGGDVLHWPTHCLTTLGQVPQMWHIWLTACHWEGSLPSTPEGCHGNLGGLWESGERQIGCEE